MSDEDLLKQYEAVAGHEAVDQLQQLARPPQDACVVHVNSTSAGGGVAEILATTVPLMRSLGLDARWETLTTSMPNFFDVTKSIHNALQGKAVDIDEASLRTYEFGNVQNAERLQPLLEDADFVFIHDP